MLVLYAIDFDINIIYIGVKVNKEYTQQKRRVFVCFYFVKVSSSAPIHWNPSSKCSKSKETS